jgi:hypothetical protein
LGIHSPHTQPNPSTRPRPSSSCVPHRLAIDQMADLHPGAVDRADCKGSLRTLEASHCSAAVSPLSGTSYKPGGNEEAQHQLSRTKI